MDQNAIDEEIGISFLPSSGESTKVLVRIPIRDGDRRRYPEVLASWANDWPVYHFEGTATINLRNASSDVHREVTQLYAKYPGLADVTQPAPNKGVAAFLERMKILGEYFFRKLFVKMTVVGQGSEKAADKAKQYLLDRLRETGIVVSIEVEPASFTSVFPIFPVGILYDESVQAENWVECFWAFRFQIAEAPEWICLGNVFSQCPLILATVDHQLDVNGIHRNATHPFHASDPSCQVYHAQSSDDVLARLTDCSAHAYYHYGHADIRADATAAANVLTWNNHSFTMADLEMAGAPTYQNSPFLAFFNGCQTNQFTPGELSTVVDRFGRNHSHRIHCIASAHKIAATLAARFGDAFWRKFLREGKSAGLAMLEARKDLLTSDEVRSPLGMLYTLYGQCSLRSLAGNGPSKTSVSHESAKNPS